MWTVSVWTARSRFTLLLFVTTAKQLRFHFCHRTGWKFTSRNCIWNFISEQEIRKLVRKADKDRRLNMTFNKAPTHHSSSLYCKHGNKGIQSQKILKKRLYWTDWCVQIPADFHKVLLWMWGSLTGRTFAKSISWSPSLMSFFESNQNGWRWEGCRPGRVIKI